MKLIFPTRQSSSAYFDSQSLAKSWKIAPGLYHIELGDTGIKAVSPLFLSNQNMIKNQEKIMSFFNQLIYAQKGVKDYEMRPNRFAKLVGTFSLAGEKATGIKLPLFQVIV